MNLDVSPEKLSPEYAQLAVNMQVSDAGVPETVNGCLIVKDIADNAYRIGYFPTRGEDYIFIYFYNHTDSTYDVNIYKYPDFTEITYQTDDIEDLIFNEPVWFARHMGEMWLGNKADGMWRWNIGNQSLRRGSAPFDIIVEVAEEGDAEKLHTEWHFAYDYEYKGGRSPLSRMARVRLYSTKHTVKVTIDTPPDISKNRRIYASPDAGTTWYNVKEVTDSNSTEEELDDELVERIVDAYTYSEEDATAISPRAKFGVEAFGYLWVANLVESPTIVQRTDVGVAYFDASYDVGEQINQIIPYGEYMIASTPNHIFGLTAEPDTQVLLSAETGAHEDSMAVVNGILYGLGDRGVWSYDGKGFKIGSGFEGLSGINLADLPDLQKPERYHLWTAQQDFEQGTYSGGISSDFIPGSLSLQPNLAAVLGLQGMLCRQNNMAVVSPYTSYIWTSRTGYDYYAQPFKIITGDAGKYTLNAISLHMKAYGTDEEFTGEIRADDSGDPDMTDDTSTYLLGTFSSGISRIRGDQTIELDNPITLDEDTLYWIVIPKQGYPGADFQIKYYNPDTTNGKQFFPQGEWLEYSDDDGGTWSNYDPGGSDTIFLRFNLLGHGDIIITSHYLSDFEHAKMGGHGYEYSYAQRFTPDRDCTAERGEIIIYTKVTDNGITFPDIEIQGDSSDAPDGSAVSTGSAQAEDDNLMTFDFDSAALSQDTVYWLVVKKNGSASDYWDYGAADWENTGETMRNSNNSWVAYNTYALWCKIFVSASGDAATFASTGTWTSNEVIIGSSDDFHKVYASFMEPAASSCDVAISYNEYRSAAYQGWNEITTFPHNITAATTKIKFKVVLTLGDSDYTPIVDSLLVTYEKENDGGAKLWAGAVKGAYWLSVEDYNDDDEEELTYVLSKYKFWHKLDQPFFDYLPIGDDICIGIGKNATETYRNLYYLDDSSVSVYYSGDTTATPMYTEWETGYLLYSHVVKQFRKLWVSITGDDDAELTMEAEVKGAERNSDDSASHVQPINLMLRDELKSEYAGFSPWLQGKYIKFKFYAYGVDWKLHDFEIGWRDCMRRNIAKPHISVYPEYVYYIEYDSDASYNYTIHTLKIADALTLAQTTTVTATYDIEAISVYNNYLYAVVSDGSDAYLYIYLIGSAGTLTLQNTGGTLYSTDHRYLGVEAMAGYVFASAGYESTVTIDRIDVSDKSAPVTDGTITLTDYDYNYVKDMEIKGNELMIATYGAASASMDALAYNPYTLVLNQRVSLGGVGAYIAAHPFNTDLWVCARTDQLLLYRGYTEIDSYDADEDSSEYVYLSWNPVNNNLYTIYYLYTSETDKYYLQVFDGGLNLLENTLLCTEDDGAEAGVYCTIDGYIVIWYGTGADGWDIILRRPDDTVVTTLEDNSNYCIYSAGQNHRAGYGKHS